jgi:hypothetical protein
MRKSTMAMIAITLTLILASSASASVRLESSDWEWSDDNLMSQTLSLVSYDTNITAFEGILYGSLNQVLAFGAITTPTMDTTSYGVDLSADTHFLFNSNELITPTVSEDQTHLQGDFGFLIPSTTIELAQIVSTGENYHAWYMCGEATDSTGSKFPVHNASLDFFQMFSFGNSIYTIGMNEKLTFNNELYTVVNEVSSLFSLKWDLDGDGQFDNATGESIDITYDYLINTLGLSPGEHTIGVAAVHNEYGLVESTEYTTLTIVPEPISFLLMAIGGLLIRRRK